MKRLLVILDGYSEDNYQKRETPLGKASLINLNNASFRAKCGMARILPLEQVPESLSCFLSILGISPGLAKGRAALEAMARGTEVPDGTAVLRCNLVRAEDGKLVDFNGGISREGAQELASAFAQEEPGFVTGQGYRNFFFPPEDYSSLCKIRFYEPHENVGESLKDIMPSAPDYENLEAAEKIRNLVERSAAFFAGRGCPGLMLWPWGVSSKPELPRFSDLYGLQGAGVCGIDLIFGLMQAVGLDTVRPAGATGEVDTDLRGKAAAAIELLKKYDFVMVHINGPDEAAHSRSFTQKCEFLSRVDAEFMGPVLGFIRDLQEGARLLVCGDHITSVEEGRHKSGDVPYLLYDSVKAWKGSGKFDELHAAKGQLVNDPVISLLLDS